MLDGKLCEVPLSPFSGKLILPLQQRQFPDRSFVPIPVKVIVHYHHLPLTFVKFSKNFPSKNLSKLLIQTDNYAENRDKKEREAPITCMPTLKKLKTHTHKRPEQWITPRRRYFIEI